MPPRPPRDSCASKDAAHDDMPLRVALSVTGKVQINGSKRTRLGPAQRKETMRCITTTDSPRPRPIECPLFASGLQSRRFKRHRLLLVELDH
jgi:hypothetical protein